MKPTRCRSFASASRNSWHGTGRDEGNSTGQEKRARARVARQGETTPRRPIPFHTSLPACLPACGCGGGPPPPLLSSRLRPDRASEPARARETQTEEREREKGGKITAARDPRIGGPLPSPSGNHAPPSHRSSALRPHCTTPAPAPELRAAATRRSVRLPPRQIWLRPRPPCPSFPRSA